MRINEIQNDCLLDNDVTHAIEKLIEYVCQRVNHKLPLHLKSEFLDFICHVDNENVEDIIEPMMNDIVEYIVNKIIK